MTDQPIADDVAGAAPGTRRDAPAPAGADFRVTATAHARDAFLPSAIRHGIALCLSGGGFRAALFHLGGVRRLNELGVLGKVDTIASVSGGSILSAFLAARIPEWPSPGARVEEWEGRVAVPFRAFTRRNLRTGPLLKGAITWKRAVHFLAARYEEAINGAPLSALPEHPGFLFCATNMATGKPWVFERTRMGDSDVGWAAPPAEWTVGRAVAASSCFPPVFRPLPVKLDPARYHGGKLEAELDGSPEARKAYVRLLKGITLTDGGNVDNLGVDVVWQDFQHLLVSDGGATFDVEPGGGLAWNLERYTGISAEQASAVRRRWLVSNYVLGTMHGGYWGIGSHAENFEVPLPFSYTPRVVAQRIAEVRTDMDAFSDREIAVLENHGYVLAEAAAQKHFRHLVTPSARPFALPHPDAADSDRAFAWLSGSTERKLPFGRGFLRRGPR